MKARASRWLGWRGLIFAAVACGIGCAGRSQGTDTPGAGGSNAGASGVATAGAGAGSVGGAQGGFASAGGSSVAGSMSTGGVPVAVACDATGCSDSEKYCRVARLNGALRLGECRAFPTSCKTCACALADFNQFLDQQNYDCGGHCFTTAGDAVGQNETSDNLIVSCGVP